MTAGPIVQERELRAEVRALRNKSNPLALAILAADILVYVALTWAAIAYRSWMLGTLAGAAIAMLFIVGHDACHGSFTKSRRLNQWIGRLAFLPSLTPFRAWELGHNQTHHVYTNLKPLDYVWMPFSKEEWVRLPWWRRALERAYRTAPGVGLYYAVEIWGRRLILPPGKRHVADSLLCIVYAAALATVGWEGLLPGVVWPFVCWNWLMGWAIFEHHTHPEVPWFDDEREWRAAGPQTRCTIHVELPPVVDVLLHFIMQHSAHHLDVTVPLYRLKDAQRAVEEAGARVVVYRWSPLTFLRHLRMCKLYDCRAKRWTGFVTAPPAP